MSASKRELITMENLTWILVRKLRELIGCGCSDWHYVRLWQADDGQFYTDGIETGINTGPTYPAYPGPGGGIDPRQLTDTLDCCDCHDVPDCGCSEEECPCTYCTCDCHEDFDITAERMAREFLDAIEFSHDAENL